MSKEAGGAKTEGELTATRVSARRLSAGSDNLAVRIDSIAPRRVCVQRRGSGAKILLQESFYFRFLQGAIPHKFFKSRELIA